LQIICEVPELASVNPERFDLKAAAAHSGCSVSTIRRRIAAGDLPAYWEKNKQVVEVANLDAVFAPCRVVPSSGDIDLDALVRQTVASWPRLTAAQRDVLSSLDRAA